jgi:hypothetical protein
MMDTYLTLDWSRVRSGTFYMMHLSNTNILVSPYPRGNSLRTAANFLPGIKVIDKGVAITG